MALTLPSLQAAAVDASGRFSQAWVGFFTRLTAAPSGVASVALTASPFSYIAPSDGMAVISGGAGIGLSLTRGRTSVALNASAGIVPLAQGDSVDVTYTTAPTVSFIPSAA